jgi:hypothetical protein
MPTNIIELRPDSGHEVEADFITGSRGAVTMRGIRVEHRKTFPAAGWWVIDPQRGAAGPYPDPVQARRALRPW